MHSRLFAITDSPAHLDMLLLLYQLLPPPLDALDRSRAFRRDLLLVHKRSDQVPVATWPVSHYRVCVCVRVYRLTTKKLVIECLYRLLCAIGRI